jgi:TRAP-type mannitol/chloroaromatic compound transport system substrate-binding protein
VLVYHYGKQNALALWGSGPAFGMDSNMLLSWHRYGGGKELLNKLYASVGANVVSFPYGPMADAAARLVQEADHQGRGLQGPQVPHGRHLDRRVHRAWAPPSTRCPAARIVPAMDRGLLDAAEFNNMTSDRVLGFPDVSKVCMLQSFHQNAEQFEIMFNKDKYNALSPKLQAIIANAVDAASADLAWKAIDRYSKDYIELQTKDNVKFYKTPDALLQSQLTIYDQVAAKKAADNPLFKEITDSQRAFAERVVKWDMDNNVNRRMAYNHYFGAKAGGSTPPKKA